MCGEVGHTQTNVLVVWPEHGSHLEISAAHKLESIFVDGTSVALVPAGVQRGWLAWWLKIVQKGRIGAKPRAKYPLQFSAHICVC